MAPLIKFYCESPLKDGVTKLLPYFHHQSALQSWTWKAKVKMASCP